MSPNKKKPRDGFDDSGWVKKKFQLPEVINNRSRKDLDSATDEKQFRQIKAELAVKEWAEKLGKDYQPFLLRFEGAVTRYITRMKDSMPDIGDQRAMLNKWESAIQSLWELVPDSASEDLVDECLRRNGVDYAEVKKLLDENHRSLLYAITLAERELGPTPRGRKANRLNRAIAEEIKDLLKEYGIDAKKYDAGICCSLLHIAYDAAGETDADPLYYMKSLSNK